MKNEKVLNLAEEIARLKEPLRLPQNNRLLPLLWQLFLKISNR
jgi:glutathionylspermidine synthase